MSMSEKVLRGASLSEPMYKICTLLSTDNVDNGFRTQQVAGRKALLDAVFGGAASASLAWRTMTGASMEARMHDQHDLFMNKTK